MRNTAEDETTFDFIAPPWTVSLDDTLTEIFLRDDALKDVEHAIDEEVYRLYAISDQDRKAIESELSDPKALQNSSSDDYIDDEELARKVWNAQEIALGESGASEVVSTVLGDGHPEGPAAPLPGSPPGRHSARPGAERREGRDGGLDGGIGRRRHPQPCSTQGADALLEGAGQVMERAGGGQVRLVSHGHALLARARGGEMQKEQVLCDSSWTDGCVRGVRAVSRYFHMRSSNDHASGRKRI
ncbi:MAG: hypothetical protein ACYDHX_16355 [Methanothrix sp.]